MSPTGPGGTRHLIHATSRAGIVHLTVTGADTAVFAGMVAANVRTSCTGEVTA